MKRNILPFLFVLPLLVSCKGVAISSDDALKILKNIEATIKDETPFENFTEIHHYETSSSKKDEKRSYNKEEKFFYQYSITSSSEHLELNTLSESWTYVKDGNILDVVRNTFGAIDPGDEPSYTVTSKQVYTEEAWKIRSDAFVSSVTSLYTNAIENARNFINQEEIDVSFTSSNTNSIYALAKQTVEGAESKEITYEYFFENNQLKLQNKKESQQSDKYEWSYGKVETFYPNIGTN